MINIIDKADCCGCTACSSICGHQAIIFSEDNEGFLYPKVDLDKCTNCGLCESVCPIISRKEHIPEPIYKGIFALRNKDTDILKNSSSGGAFSAIANFILSKGGKVVGAKYDANMCVEHTIVSSVDDLGQLRGSKYSQSDLNNLFREIRKLLIDGTIVLFSGTPCQVAGLNLFLRKKFDNLVTVDIVCHAVPSPKIFREYIEYVDQKFHDRVIGINMRDKRKHGWSHVFSYSYKFASGKERIDPLFLTPWSKLFFSKLIDRPSCHECKFTNYSRPGDITIADLWDDRNLRPDIKSREGTSLYIANTPKGLSILDEIKPNLEVWEITKDESWQPCLSRPTEANPNRSEFWYYYNKHGFSETLNKYFKESKTKIIKRETKKIIKRALKPILKNEQ